MKKKITENNSVNSKLNIIQFIIKQVFSTFINNQNNKSTLEKYQMKIDLEKKILSLDKKINSLNYKINTIKNRFLFLIIINIIIILYLLGIYFK